MVMDLGCSRGGKKRTSTGWWIALERGSGMQLIDIFSIAVWRVISAYVWTTQTRLEQEGLPLRAGKCGGSEGCVHKGFGSAVLEDIIYKGTGEITVKESIQHFTVVM